MKKNYITILFTLLLVLIIHSNIYASFVYEKNIDNLNNTDLESYSYQIDDTTDFATPFIREMSMKQDDNNYYIDYDINFENRNITFDLNKSLITDEIDENYNVSNKVESFGGTIILTEEKDTDFILKTKINRNNNIYTYKGQASSNNENTDYNIQFIKDDTNATLTTYDIKLPISKSTLGINFKSHINNVYNDQILDTTYFPNKLYGKMFYKATASITCNNTMLDNSYFKYKYKGTITIPKKSKSKYKYLQLISPKAVKTGIIYNQSANGLNLIETYKGVKSISIDISNMYICGAYYKDNVFFNGSNNHNWTYTNNANTIYHEKYCNKCKWMAKENHNLEFEYDGITHNACHCGYISKVYYSYFVDGNFQYKKMYNSFSSIEKPKFDISTGKTISYYIKSEKQYVNEDNIQFSENNTPIKEVVIGNVNIINDKTALYSTIYNAITKDIEEEKEIVLTSGKSGSSGGQGGSVVFGTPTLNIENNDDLPTITINNIPKIDLNWIINNSQVNNTITLNQDLINKLNSLGINTSDINSNTYNMIKNETKNISPNDMMRWEKLGSNIWATKSETDNILLTQSIGTNLNTRAALINPNAYNTSKLNANFKVLNNGNNNTGYLFNITKNNDNTLNGYMLTLTEDIGEYDYNTNSNLYSYIYNRYTCYGTLSHNQIMTLNEGDLSLVYSCNYYTAENDNYNNVYCNTGYYDSVYRYYNKVYYDLVNVRSGFGETHTGHDYKVTTFYADFKRLTDSAGTYNLSLVKLDNVNFNDIYNNEWADNNTLINNNIINLSNGGKLTTLSNWQQNRTKTTYNDYNVIYNNGVINVLCNNNLVASVSEATYTKGTYGFYANTQDRTQGLNLYDYNVETEELINYEDILNNIQYRDNSIKVNITIDDTQNPTINTNNTVINLLSNNINSAFWGDTNNQSISTNLLNRVDNKGIFTTHNDNQLAIDNTAQYIKSLIEQLNNNDYYILGDNIELIVEPENLRNNATSEDFPNGRWLINHNHTYFDNTIGIISNNNKYIKDLNCDFDKTGQYNIKFDDNLIKEIYIHRKPIADFDLIINDTNITLQSNSYDLDKIDNNGIKNIKWFYKNINATNWTEGQLNNWNRTDIIVVKLEVEDYQGAKSSCIKFLGTGNPQALFFVNKEIISNFKTLTTTNSSYDPTGLEIISYNWQLMLNNTLISSSTERNPIFDLMGYATGNYQLSLVVKNINNINSKPYIKNIRIITDTEKPYYVLDPELGNGFINKLVINLSVYDLDSGINYYKYAISTNSNATNLLYSNNLTTPSTTIKLNNDLNGEYYLYLYIEDNNHNVLEDIIGAYKLDNNKPIINNVYINKENYDISYMSISATDGLSGIKGYYYSATPLDINNITDFSIFNMPQSNSFTKYQNLYIYAIDNCNNISEPYRAYINVKYNQGGGGSGGADPTGQLYKKDIVVLPDLTKYELYNNLDMFIEQEYIPYVKKIIEKEPEVLDIIEKDIKIHGFTLTIDDLKENLTEEEVVEVEESLKNSHYIFVSSLSKNDNFMSFIKEHRMPIIIIGSLLLLLIIGFILWYLDKLPFLRRYK